MATVPASISVEEPLQTSYHPDCDYLDGELEERPRGEHAHNRILQQLLLWFGTKMQEWRIDPIKEQRLNISLSRDSVCDVVLLPSETSLQEIASTPPLLCIEILSPDDRISRATKVLADYASIGVKQSWLIDPLRREAFVYDSKGLHPVEQDRLELPGTPIYLVLSGLFAALDKRA